MSTESNLSPQELFDWAGLAGHGPFPWKTGSVREKSSGIYIITAAGMGVVYIGRAKRLNKRLNQFIRHKCGNSEPHKGGEAIIHLGEPGVHLQIYYAVCNDYAEKETSILEYFYQISKRLPFGNKKRGNKLPPSLNS